MSAATVHFTCRAKAHKRAWHWVHGLLVWVVFVGATSATPIWHCSRQPGGQDDASDHMNLAVMGTGTEAIPVSMVDLLSVYSGHEVSIGGRPLTACMLKPDQLLAVQVIDSLGLENVHEEGQARAQSVARPSWIRQVQTEQEMIDCISTHGPAVGFLPKTVHQDQVTPCF